MLVSFIDGVIYDDLFIDEVVYLRRPTVAPSFSCKSCMLLLLLFCCCSCCILLLFKGGNMHSLPSWKKMFEGGLGCGAGHTSSNIGIPFVLVCGIIKADFPIRLFLLSCLLYFSVLIFTTIYFCTVLCILYYTIYTMVVTSYFSILYYTIFSSCMLFLCFAVGNSNRKIFSIVLS